MGAEPARSVLIISFSEISIDARVLKQINRFRHKWSVTTCGFGPAPQGVSRHLQVPDESRSLALDGRLITLKQYNLAYWSLPAVRSAWNLTKSFKGRFDVILANEPETVPIALKLKPRLGIHADLHEYTPSLHEQVPEWNRRIKPYFEWLINKYTTKADSWTSPGDGVGREYLRKFRFLPKTVTNAAPYQELSPAPVGNPLRIVHHGGAQRNRNLDVMISGFQASSLDATFDLYLTGVDPVYRDELRKLVEDDARVNVYDGIPYEKLIKSLNSYDLGIHVLPPVNFNNKWALPNKLFDFVQARLGQIVGPSPEMQKIVDHYGIGTVTDGFTAEDITRALDTISEDDVTKWKNAAQESAWELGSEPQVDIWDSEVSALMDRK